MKWNPYQTTNPNEPIPIRKIVAGLDGRYMAMWPNPDAIRIGLPEQGGYPALLKWLRDCEIRASINGPFFDYFECRGERRVEFDVYVLSTRFSVWYELEMYCAEQRLRFEDDVREYAGKHDWVRNYSIDWHDLRREHQRHVEADSLKWITSYCGGLPGESVTVETDKRVYQFA